MVPCGLFKNYGSIFPPVLRVGFRLREINIIYWKNYLLLGFKTLDAEEALTLDTWGALTFLSLTCCFLDFFR